LEKEDQSLSQLLDFVQGESPPNILCCRFILVHAGIYAANL